MPHHPEGIYQVVGTFEVPHNVQDAEAEVLKYTRLARKHPGCVSSNCSRDLETAAFRVYQEWSGKEQFLMWLKESVQLDDGFSVSYYEAAPFRMPEVGNRPHHVWGRAERKQLTKNDPHLFFLSIDGRQRHALFNNTADLQFDVQMRFPKQEMKPCEGSGVTQSGEHFKVTVFPGQTVPFVTGKWNGGYALSYSYGPVTDKDYLDQSAKEIAERVSRDVQQFKDFLARNGLNADAPGIMEDDLRKQEFEEEATRICREKNRATQDAPKYVDLTWPPCQASICRPQEGKVPVRGWMRPHEFLEPQLRDQYDLMIADSDGGVPVEPGDIDQGALGDCWFMAAIAACAEMPEELVKPMFQDILMMKREHLTWKKEHKAEIDSGFFRIRLAKHGWWRWHYVDSYLPVTPIQCPGGPCFAKNRQQPNELWVAMLEKVYAKCHRSYQAIAGGDPAVALSDLTGFPTVTFEWPDKRAADSEQYHKVDSPQLFEKILQHDRADRMIWVTTPGEDTTDYDAGGGGATGGGQARTYDSVGLVTGHAYTILKAVKVPKAAGGKDDFHRLVQIRNPWGGAKEWNGDWCDYDPSQRQTSMWIRYPEVAQAIAERWHNDYPSGAGLSGNAGPGTVLEKKADGSYWMSWEDTLRWFDGGGVCLRQKGWQDVRFKTGFSNGFPDHFFKITPSSTCQGIAFAVQHDRRGLAKDDPRNDPCALRIEVLTPGQKKPMFDTIAQSNDGVFMYANQVVAFNCVPTQDAEDHLSMEPFEMREGQDYYIIVRQHPNEQKQHVRNRDGIVVVIQTSDGNRSGPRSVPGPIKGIQAFNITDKVKEACRYVGYYGLTDENAALDVDIPCQHTYKGATDTNYKQSELWHGAPTTGR